MQIYIIFLIVSLIVFTYTLYLLGREDVIFIRKNVNLELLFNLFFLTLIVSLFFARLFFVVFNLDWMYVNPINFFSLLSKPGMSVIGGVVGGSLFLFYYARLKKLPLGRIFDFFALSFFSAIPIGVFGTYFLSEKVKFTESIFLPILYIVLFIFLIKIVFPKLLQGLLRSGSIGLLVGILFSLIWILTSMVKNDVGLIGFVTLEDMLAGIFLIVGLGLFLKQEVRNR